MSKQMSTNQRVTEVDEKEDFLNVDAPIRGQEFVCLSFLSPEKVLEKKDLFFFQKFMKFYEAKIRFEMLEKFLAEFGNRQNDALDLSIKYAAKCVADEVSSMVSSQVTDGDGNKESNDEEEGGEEEAKEDDVKPSSQEVKSKITEVLAEKMSGSKVNLSSVFESFRAYVEKHRPEVASKENIEESYKDFIFNKEQELEDEFHAQNDFRTSIRGVKVRGSYSSHKEACARAKRLQKEDPAHDVFVGQVGYWLPWDPAPHNIEEQEYADKEMNLLMKKHKEKQEMKKELFEAEKNRKVEAAKQAVEENRRMLENDEVTSDPASAPSSDNVRNISEARDIMKEMEENRIPINPSQVTNEVNERRAGGDDGVKGGDE